jgi:hypothetical protein
MAGFDSGFKAGAVIERKQHVIDWRAVGHGKPRSGGIWVPSSHESAPVSTVGWARRSQSPALTGKSYAKEEDLITNVDCWLATQC